MNLADYSKRERSNSNYLKFTRNGEVKVLRFLYTSKDGADIPVVKKCWDDEQKKFVYDTPEGKLTCSLSCVLYENGQEPKLVKWERSAAFTEQVCNGYWSKFPRIIDGVWEVTCTNPGTKDIKFAWFPITGADLTTYPLPEGVSIVNGQVVQETSVNAPVSDVTTTPATTATTTATKRYWE